MKLTLLYSVKADGKLSDLTAVFWLALLYDFVHSPAKGTVHLKRAYYLSDDLQDSRQEGLCSLREDRGAGKLQIREIRPWLCLKSLPIHYSLFTT